MTCFFIWLPEKNAASLCRYPENNLFTLRKKTNTYWKLKKALCEKRLFFCPYVSVSFLFRCSFFKVVENVLFVDLSETFCNFEQYLIES